MEFNSAPWRQPYTSSIDCVTIISSSVEHRYSLCAIAVKVATAQPVMLPLLIGTIGYIGTHNA